MKLEVIARVALVAVLACLVTGCGISKKELATEVRQQQQRFQSIVVALEQFRVSRGRYPDSLADLSQQIPNVTIPKGQPSLEAVPLSYDVARDRSFFRLVYGIADRNDSDLHAIAIYSSLASQWDISGFPGAFSGEEAKQYGARFRQTGSYIDLDFTVESLLDSVRKTNAHPCRNLWRAWVYDALGSGHATSKTFQNAPAHAEARVFSSSNQKRTYAFLFRDQVYPPMTKPLSIVVAIYRGNGGQNTAVSLQQLCDSSA